MYLFKRSNGRYYIRYQQLNGKMTCISTCTKTKSDALRFVSNFRKELDFRESHKTIPIKLKDFFREFLKYSESVHRPKHTETLEASFNVIMRYFGDIALSELTITSLQKYAEDRLRSVSVHSVKRDKANLSSAFSYAISRKYLLDNIAKMIRHPKLPEKQPSFLGDYEFDLLLDKVKEADLKDLFIFAVNTGLRQMELLTLHWGQIDFKDKYVILDNSGYLTKSKKVRTIPLSLKAMQIVTNRELKKNGQLVFTLEGKPIKPDYISHKFKSYVLESRINSKLNFHSLRHTFASWLVQRGVSIYEVSKLLGHSSVNVTQIYSHLRTDDLKNAIDKLN